MSAGPQRITRISGRGMPLRGRYVGGGIFVGLMGAVLVAGFAGALSNALSGAGQEVFNRPVSGAMRASSERASPRLVSRERKLGS